MNRERFRFFRVVHHESDLLVGVPHHSDLTGIEQCAEGELIRLRAILLEHSKKDPHFLSALEPIGLSGPSSEEVATMISCGQLTGTGPMASVAGLFAEQVGKRIIESFGAMEVVVENGGDLYLRNASDLVSVIHAGRSSLSDKMAFVVPAGEWGICTSSGTMGHSFSRGQADAVTVIAESAPLADAWATAIANRIRGVADMERELEGLTAIPEIKGCAIIVENQVGIRGELEVKLLPVQGA
jgi:ApbE superfamily uncharacterized protein (UPF0280 family)